MMLPDGRSGITVKKDELLSQLRENRSKHYEIFVEAQKGYREDIIKELDAMLHEARSGKSIRRAVALIEPQDHTRDYDRIIRMLEMSVTNTVFINEQEFAQYVQDDWGWKRAFTESASNYLNRH